MKLNQLVPIAMLLRVLLYIASSIPFEAFLLCLSVSFYSHFFGGRTTNMISQPQQVVKLRLAHYTKSGLGPDSQKLEIF